MNASAFDPSRPAGQSPSPRESSETEGIPERGLLEKVLQQTLSGGAAVKLDPGDLEALRKVARTHRGKPLVLDPVAVELVYAILCVQFPEQFRSAVTAKAMSAEIARALIDDPTGRQRLEAIWTDLGESSV